MEEDARAPAVKRCRTRRHVGTERIGHGHTGAFQEFDPVVPAFNQASYLAVTTAAGTSDLLVQRVVTAAGHCGFTQQDIGQAFADLVLWTQYGIKPAG